MTTNTQLEIIKAILEETGEISRNHCLSMYVSRLGARIADLKKLGWQFTTKTSPTTRPDGSKGKDFIYELISKPI